MIRIHYLSLIVFLAAAATCDIANAAGPFAFDGKTIVVTTDRYRVVFENLAITEIQNKLTGETYAAPPPPTAPATQPSVTLTKMLSEHGIAVESMRPGVPVKRYRIGPKTVVAPPSITDTGATITYRGLECGAEFAPNMTITLSLAIEAKTGDLIIKPEVKGNIEEVHGVRDRGILSNSLQVYNLAAPLKMVLPVSEGHAWSAAPDSPLFTKDWAIWAWPQNWEAALAIAESDKGCLAIWADEPTLRYGRYFSMCRSNGLWNFGFQYETSDVIYRCDDITNAIWRLNVFTGYWTSAAARYVEQMKRDGMKTIAEKTPAWAANVHVVLHGLPDVESAKSYAAMLPKDSLIAPTWQGWMKGWNTGEIGEGSFPNWPPNMPDHYEAADDVAKLIPLIEAIPVHVFPYTNPTCVRPDWHPWLKEKIHERHFLAWKIWQRMHPEFCLDIVKRYGVTGIYEDCSWGMGRHFSGAPDGDNWVQGSVHMREYFKELMPNVAIIGERNNEITARGQNFALGWIPASEGTRHPINAYLFNPFILMWNLAFMSGGGSYDDDDIRGFTLTSWPANLNPQPMQEDLMVRKRGLVFAQENLVDYWPQKWDPTVMHYFKGKDGSEFRFVQDRGTRFVKSRADGKWDMIYWRLHGEREVDAPGVGIDGWLGYNGEKIVGLNPNVPLYVTLEGVARPPAVISAVPDGFVIHRSVVRDGFWIATLDLADHLKTVPAPEVKDAALQRTVKTVHVHASATQPVRFVGVESSKQISPGEYDVSVSLPGGFGAIWSEPTTVAVGQDFSTLPLLATTHDRFSGALYGRYEKPNVAWAPVGNVPVTEGTLPWLVTLPAQPMKLVFSYGTEHGYGDGANYMVRVNGREIWKEYRQQTSSNPEEVKVHRAPPISSGSVDLSAYAGQMIILELSHNGNQSGGSETISWQHPHLEAAAK